MRTIFTLSGLGIIGLLAACSSGREVSGNSESATSAATSTPVVALTTVTLTKAPNCIVSPKTPCATFVAHTVNGSVPDESISGFTYGSPALTPSVQAELEGVEASTPQYVVLRGSFGPKVNASSIPTFNVVEAYLGETGMSYGPTATFYLGTASPCDGGTCAGTMSVLNTQSTFNYGRVTIGSGASVSSASLISQIESDDAVVAGTVTNGPSTLQTTLNASQVFVKMPLAVDAGAPRLRVSGAQILGPNGGPVVLRGWNWGEWGVVQPGDAGDAVQNAQQGATIVRIPLRWWGDYGNDVTGAPIESYTPDAGADAGAAFIDPAHLAELDSLVAQAAGAKLWIDLTIDSNCGQASYLNDTVSYCGQNVDAGKLPDGGGVPNNFMNDSVMKERFTEAWVSLATRYKNQAFIGMYEIMPEPNFGCPNGNSKDCPDASLPLAPQFYAPIIDRIRTVDPVTPILVGATGGYEIGFIASAYITGDAGPPPGIIYTGDLLDKKALDPTNLDAAVAFSAAKNVPIFIQQVGIEESKDVAPDGGSVDAGPDADDSVKGIMEALRSNSIGWTWWEYREIRTNGNSYAPVYENVNDPTPTWSVNAPWLDEIAGYFKSP